MAAFTEVIANRENLPLRVEQKLKIHLINYALTRLGDLCEPRGDGSDCGGGLLDDSGERAQFAERGIAIRRRLRNGRFDLRAHGCQLHQGAVTNLATPGQRRNGT